MFEHQCIRVRRLRPGIDVLLYFHQHRAVCGERVSLRVEVTTPLFDLFSNVRSSMTPGARTIAFRGELHRRAAEDARGGCIAAGTHLDRARKTRSRRRSACRGSVRSIAGGGDRFERDGVSAHGAVVNRQDLLIAADRLPSCHPPEDRRDQIGWPAPDAVVIHASVNEPWPEPTGPGQGRTGREDNWQTQYFICSSCPRGPDSSSSVRAALHGALDASRARRNRRPAVFP